MSLHDNTRNYKFIRTDFLKHDFWVTASWKFKKMLKKCPSWISMQSMQETRLLGPFIDDISLWSRLSVTSCNDSLCFLSALLGPYFHKFSLGPTNCFKMWIYRLGFIHGSCRILLNHILFLQFANSWMFFWNNG